MKSLLPSALSLQLAELGASQRLLVCTDYDGTLAPIAYAGRDANNQPINIELAIIEHFNTNALNDHP